MGKALREIAQDLKGTTKKVQLIYAFNGTRKTRLSREFNRHVDAGLNPQFASVPQALGQLPWGMCAPILA